MAFGVSSADKSMGSVDVGAILDETASRYGIDPATFRRFAQIESGLNPRSVSKTGAKGLFQFTNGTARQYGLSNPFDPAANADAAARLMRDNGAKLTTALGRAPTAGELYLAHQQGALGAIALLSHPNLSAVDALAPVYGGNRDRAATAIYVNGGDPTKPAGDFSQKWTAHFTGATSLAGNKAPTAAAPAKAEPGYPTLDRGENEFAALRALKPAGITGASKMMSFAPAAAAPGISVPLMPLSSTAAKAPEVSDDGRFVAMTEGEYRAWQAENT